MAWVLLHNFLRKSRTSAAKYTPRGTMDVYDTSGKLITPGAWRNVKDYNAMQNLPHVPRRSPLNAVKIRDEFTSYFCQSSNT